MEQNNSYATPTPTRRVGLSRRGANSTPGLGLPVLVDTPNPSIDEKQRQHSRKHKSDDKTPRTLPAKLSGASTICRRPGLSRLRNEVSKKRLQFATENEQKENLENQNKATATSKPLEQQQPSTEPSEVAATKTESKDDVQLAKSCESIQHQIAELDTDIAMWKRAFVEAFNDLQEMMQPPLSTELLLEKMGIPLEMQKHLDPD